MRTMMLVAVDVAILPPPDVMATAIEYNAALSAHSEPGSLRLDDEHLPHITLTQHFIRADELDRAFLHVNAVLADQPPVRVAITGGGRSNRTLWMSVERTLELVELLVISLLVVGPLVVPLLVVPVLEVAAMPSEVSSDTGVEESSQATSNRRTA